MFSKYKKININFKASIWTLIVTVCIFAITSFCFFIGYKDIPLGFLLGGSYGSFIYLIQGLVENKELAKGNLSYSISIMVLRLVIFTVLLVVVALLTYQFNIVIFNVFSYVGGYIISTVVLAVLNLISGRRTK